MVSKAESPPLIGPRMSFSDGGDFICMSPVICKEKEVVKGSVKVSDFEFLSENVSPQRMHTADELFSEGKLLPFWQEKYSEKLKNVNLKSKEEEEEENHKVEAKDKNRVSWFLDEDPSPRPPKCTVLWKELLRLKKQRNSRSSLSPSSSTSSSSSLEDKREEKEGKRGKKGIERKSMRIRPMIHVPVCTLSKSSVPLPPLFPLRLKKNRVEKST
ncbi:unnamed protein product [Eruca vesicaria subsp. sativa]|uniref:Uncharacterized protein n=1 Tax=Eruca vesicaria subsp. sativa TaxID=29727 RepID=A0ABC8K3J7_ERUVS|nr:unnamed protein product [Eruca vesicaria subsp. sativa]